jgi:N-acetylneuraminic acid mutarotase
VIAALLAAAAAMWQTDPPLPVARSEVAGANWRGYAVVAGGFLADGTSSARVDAYNSRIQEWSRLPDLPVAVNHAMAVAGGGRLYVFGGYGPAGARRDAYVLNGPRWRRLPDLPTPRHGVAVIGVDATVHVIGGGPQPGLSVSVANESFVLTH